MIQMRCPRIAPPCSFVVESPMYHLAVLEMASHLAEHLQGRSSSAMSLALGAPYVEEGDSGADLPA